MSDIVSNSIVKLVFDNSKFESGVSESLQTIRKLKDSLDFSDGASAFKQVENVVNSMDFAAAQQSVNKLQNGMYNMGEAVTFSAKSFLDLESGMVSFIAKATVIQNLTNKVTNAITGVGSKLIQEDVVAPFSNGWKKYESQLTNMRTLVEGAGKDQNDVQIAMEKLQWYADETSYDFANMTDVLSKFVSKGRELDETTQAIMGMANWAAKTGTSASTASRVFTEMAKAGKVIKQQDWVSVGTMSTKEIKEQFLAEAYVQKTINKDNNGYYYWKGSGKNAHKEYVDANTFETSLTEAGFLTQDVFFKVMGRYGSGSDAVFAAVQKSGASAGEEIKKIIATYEKYSAAIDAVRKDSTLSEKDKQARIAAIDALEEFAGYKDLDINAVKAFSMGQITKTYSDAVTAVKENIGTSYLDIFNSIFGDMNESAELWSGVYGELYAVFADGPRKLANAFLKWKDGEDGRTELIDALWGIYGSVKTIVGSVKNGLLETILGKYDGNLVGVLQKITRFLSGISDWLGGINQSSIKGLQNLMSLIGKTVHAMFAWAIGLGKIVLDLLPPIAKGIGWFLSLFSDVVEETSDGLDENAFNLGGPLSESTKHMNVFRQAIADLGIALDVIIELFENVNVYVKKAFSSFKETETYASISDTLTSIKNGLKMLLPYVGKLPSLLASNLPKIIKALGSAIEYLAIGLIKMGGWVLSHADQIIGKIHTAVVWIKDLASKTVLPAAAFAIGAFGIALSNLWEVVKKIASPIIDFFSNLKLHMSGINDMKLTTAIAGVDGLIEYSFDLASAYSLAKVVLKDALEAIQGFFWNTVDAVDGLTNWNVRTKLENFGTSVSNLWDTVKKVATGKIDFSGIDILSSIGTWIKSSALKVWNGLTVVFWSLIRGISTLTGYDLETKLKNIGTQIGNLFNKFNAWKEGGFKFVVPSVKAISDWIVKAAVGFKNGAFKVIDGVKQSISEHLTGGKSWNEVLSDWFSNRKTMRTAIASADMPIDNDVIKENFGNSPKVLQRILDTILTNMSTFGHAAFEAGRNFIGQIGAGIASLDMSNILKLAGVGTLLYFIYKIDTILKSSTFTGSIKNVLASIEEVNKSKVAVNKAEAFKSLAGGILAIAGGLILLSTIPTRTLIIAAAAITAVTIASSMLLNAISGRIFAKSQAKQITTAGEALKTFSDKVTDAVSSTAKAPGTMLTKIGEGMVEGIKTVAQGISETIKTYGSAINKKAMTGLLGVIVLFIGEMVGIMYLLDQFPLQNEEHVMQIAGGLLLAVVAMLAVIAFISRTMTKTSKLKMDTKTWDYKMQSLGLIAEGIDGFLKSAGSYLIMNSISKVMTSVFLFILGLAALIEAASYVPSGNNLTTVIMVGTALIGTLLVLGTIAKLASDKSMFGKLDPTKALDWPMAMLMTVGRLAKAVEVYIIVDSIEKILTAVGIFIGFMTGLMYAMDKLDITNYPKLLSNLGIALGSVAAIIASIGFAIYLINKGIGKISISDKSLTGFQTFMEVIGRIGAIAGIAVGAVSIAVALTLIVPALTKLQDVSWDSVLKGAVALVAIGGAIGLAAGIFQHSPVTGIVFAIGMLAAIAAQGKTVGTGLIHIANGIEVFADTIGRIWNSINPFFQIIIQSAAIWALVRTFITDMNKFTGITGTEEKKAKDTGNVFETLGGKLKDFGDRVGKGLSNIGEGFKNFFTGLGNVLKSTLAFAIAVVAVSASIRILGDSLPKFAKSLIDNADVIIKAVAIITTGVLLAFKAGKSKLSLKAVAIVTTVMSAVMDAMRNNKDTILKFVKDVLDFIIMFCKDYAPTLVTAFADIIHVLAEAIKDAKPEIISAFEDIFDTIHDIVEGLIDTIGEKLGLSKLVDTIAQTFGFSVSPDFSGMIADVATLATLLAPLAPTVEKLSGGFGNVIKAFVKTPISAVGDVVSGIGSAIGGVQAGFLDAKSGGLWTKALQSYFGDSSNVAKLTAGDIADLDAVKKAIREMEDDAFQWRRFFTGKVNRLGIVDVFKSAFSFMGGGWITNGRQNKVDSLTSNIKTLTDAIAQASIVSKSNQPAAMTDATKEALKSIAGIDLKGKNRKEILEAANGSLTTMSSELAKQSKWLTFFTGVRWVYIGAQAAAAIYNVSKAWKNYKENQYRAEVDFSDAQKVMNQSVEQAIDSYTQSKEAIHAYASEMVNNTKTYKDLAYEYDTIMAKGDEATEWEKTRGEFIKTKVAEYLGIERDAVDEVAKKYGSLAGAISSASMESQVENILSLINNDDMFGEEVMEAYSFLSGSDAALAEIDSQIDDITTKLEAAKLRKQQSIDEATDDLALIPYISLNHDVNKYNVQLDELLANREQLLSDISNSKRIVKDRNALLSIYDGLNEAEAEKNRLLAEINELDAQGLDTSDLNDQLNAVNDTILSLINSFEVVNGGYSAYIGEINPEDAAAAIQTLEKATSSLETAIANGANTRDLDTAIQAVAEDFTALGYEGLKAAELYYDELVASGQKDIADKLYDMVLNAYGITKEQLSNSEEGKKGIISTIAGSIKDYLSGGEVPEDLKNVVNEFAGNVISELPTGDLSTGKKAVADLFNRLVPDGSFDVNKITEPLMNQLTTAISSGDNTKTTEALQTLYSSSLVDVDVAKASEESGIFDQNPIPEGTTYSEYLKNLYVLTDLDAAEVIDKIDEGLSNATENTTPGFWAKLFNFTTVKAEDIDTDPAAEAYMSSLGTSMTNATPTVTSTIQTKVVPEITNSLDISEEAKTAGDEVTKSYGEGAVENISEKTSKFGTVGDKSISALKTGSNGVSRSTEAHTIGTNVTYGFANGMLNPDGLAYVDYSAAYVGTRALNTLKQTLGERSPSKITYGYGDFLVVGLANGITDNIKKSVDAAMVLGDSLIDGIKHPLNTISEIAAGAIDVDPSIRPVLDLSNVTSGAALLSDMFNDQSVTLAGKVTNVRSSNDVINDAISNSLADTARTITEANANQNAQNQTITLNTPLYLNGRQVAKATATYTKSELDSLAVTANRKGGKR